MIKTYCFKLYNAKRNKKLHRQINAAGLIYNHCIALHKRYYKLFHKKLNLYILQKHLTKIKKIPRFSYLKEIGSQAVQDITQRIDKAYKLFFRNLKHKIRTAPPSFKKIKKYKSFTLKQAGWKLDEDNHKIIINNQHYHYFKSRPIQGQIKTVTVKRDALGDIYLYFTVEAETNEVISRTGKSVGFDFGLKLFLTASDNQDIPSPLFFKRNRKAIIRANRLLSRKTKKSNNYRKAKTALARLHKKTANQRSDFHWKTAHLIISRYPTICLENLCIKAMYKKHGKKIADLGFSDFLNKLEYLAQTTGTTVIKVDRFYPSSQLCSSCGYKNKAVKDLRIREWDCPVCGIHHDRDKNAAVNIEREGLRLLAS